MCLELASDDSLILDNVTAFAFRSLPCFHLDAHALYVIAFSFVFLVRHKKITSL